MDISSCLKAVEDKVKTIDDLIDEQDDIQQYIRRDCVEVTIVPMLPDEKPKEIIKEIGLLMGIEIVDHQISTAHRLPPTRKAKDKLIVKFVHRDVKDLFYKQ